MYLQKKWGGMPDATWFQDAQATAITTVAMSYDQCLIQGDMTIVAQLQTHTESTDFGQSFQVIQWKNIIFAKTVPGLYIKEKKNLNP